MVSSSWKRADAMAKKSAGSRSSPPRRRFPDIVKPVAGLVACLCAATAQATVFELPAGESTLLGREERVVTSIEDTLYEIARRFSLGSEEMLRVNPDLDPWLPGAGRNLV